MRAAGAVAVRGHQAPGKAAPAGRCGCDSRAWGPLAAIVLPSCSPPIPHQSCTSTHPPSATPPTHLLSHSSHLSTPLQELYSLWFAHLWDNIYSVREDSAVALGNAGALGRVGSAAALVVLCTRTCLLQRAPGFVVCPASGPVHTRLPPRIPALQCAHTATRRCSVSWSRCAPRWIECKDAAAAAACTPVSPARHCNNAASPLPHLSPFPPATCAQVREMVLQAKEQPEDSRAYGSLENTTLFGVAAQVGMDV